MARFFDTALYVTPSKNMPSCSKTGTVSIKKTEQVMSQKILWIFLKFMSIKLPRKATTRLFVLANR